MSAPPRGSSDALVEHSFRHEHARLVATLVRKLGVAHLALIEDAVQGALMLALTSWALQGNPDDPAAWLYRVAHNRILDVLRAQKVRLSAHARDDALEDALHDPSSPRFAREVEDAQLRMLFVCCDGAIPVESQLVLALKVLCGFGVGEIARALFLGEANVRKRLERARGSLRERSPELDTPSDAVLAERLDRVHTVLYLLFNEGYQSSRAEQPIRRELCEEAIRLATFLSAHPIGDAPATAALLALMYFHTARLAARVDGNGVLMLLEDQDRSLWDRALIDVGLTWLTRSARGDSFTRYHAEAGIAAEHCLAPSFASTRWTEIDALYQLLERAAPSPLNLLNRAIAVAHHAGPRQALALLEGVDIPDWLKSYYLRDAVLGELHRQAGDLTLAAEHLRRALAATSIEAERVLLRKRLAQCTH